MVVIAYNDNSQIVSSITAKLTSSGREIRTKKSIKEIMVRTSMSIPTKRPLCAWAQSTE